jgi:hypothetical protein
MKREKTVIVTPVVEHLPTKNEAQNSNFSTAKKSSGINQY